MIITNVSSGNVTISDLPGGQSGQGLTLGPGASATIYDQDADKSLQLGGLITAGLVSKTGTAEPSAGQPTAEQAALIVGATGAPLKLSGVAAAGMVPVASSATLAAWGAPPSGAPSGAAGGDLGGTYPNPTVLDVAHVTTGVLAVANGGTGAATAPLARTSLGAAASGANSDITSLAGLTTPLSGAQGGNGLAVSGTPAAGSFVEASSSSAAAWTPLANHFLFLDSAAGSGGSASEAMTVTGLLTTDVILAVSQTTPGSNNLALIGFNTQAANALTAVWALAPGAGAVIRVAIFRA